MSEPQDIKAAQGTYDSFIGMLKWSVPLLAAIALLVIFIIS